jgi:hypothetical protein
VDSDNDDWSPFTGNCDTKDPTGTQHHCCSAGDATQYCPTATFLSALTDLSVWAEGVVDSFNVEVKWVGASKVVTPPTTDVDTALRYEKVGVWGTRTASRCSPVLDTQIGLQHGPIAK